MNFKPVINYSKYKMAIFREHRILREEICDAIYTVIPEVPRLVQLFHKWSNLDQQSRTILDKEAETWGCPERIDLYLALTDAFLKWERVQATEVNIKKMIKIYLIKKFNLGAPGCDSRLFDFNPNVHMQQQLLFMVEDLESMVDTYAEENIPKIDIHQNTASSNIKHRAPFTNKSNLHCHDVTRTQSLKDFSDYRYD